MDSRTAFFVSDRTGITAETMGLSLISQFEEIYFTHVTLPFVDSPEKAQAALEKIEAAKNRDNARPIVFGTIINQAVKEVIVSADAYFIDFFGTFIAPLENELKVKSSHSVGKIHGVRDPNTYNTRIDAVNFALNYDDGARTQGYKSADVILIGVSRCGKTPTSLYMAMQFGIRTANYPLTEEDLETGALPKVLKSFRTKLFGLSIDPKRLHSIRGERRPNSRYAQLDQCIREVRAVEKLYVQENIPFLNSTTLSIEELSTKIMLITGLERRLR